MSPIKQNYKKGYCDKCDGMIQFDKDNQYYYCVECNKIWDEDSWDDLVKRDKQDDYQFREYGDNLQALNFMGRPEKY